MRMLALALVIGCGGGFETAAGQADGARAGGQEGALRRRPRRPRPRRCTTGSAACRRSPLGRRSSSVNRIHERIRGLSCGSSTPTPQTSKKLLVEFVCMATGGPCKYDGPRHGDARTPAWTSSTRSSPRSSRTSSGALDKFKVPAKEKGELLGALGPLKPQIVVAADEAASRSTQAKLAKVDRSSPRTRARTSAAKELLDDGRRSPRKRGQRIVRRAAVHARRAAAPARALVALDRATFRAGAPPAHHHRAQDDAEGHRAAAQATRRQLRRRTSRTRSRERGSLAGTLQDRRQAARRRWASSCCGRRRASARSARRSSASSSSATRRSRRT